MKIGVIGSGMIGGTLARRFVELGHDVTISNSRGPQTLTETAKETGAAAGTVADAIAGADVLVLAVPLKVVPALSKARPRRRQTIRNVPSGTLIGTTERSAASTDPRPPPKLGNPALSDDERT